MKILIALPVHNEELILAKNIKLTLDFCRQNFPNNEFRIIIAENNSKDQTLQIGCGLANEFAEVGFVSTVEKGKGRGIKAAWESEPADVYIFMDADLATDLSALPELIKSIEAGFDLVIGSRFHAKSKVDRSLFRKTVSLGYFMVLKTVLGLKINDAPCGFKAISQKAKEALLPQIENLEWFFDSELVILAEKQGFKIKEIPVDWSEKSDFGRKSKINLFKIAPQYLNQVLRIKKRIKNS